MSDLLRHTIPARTLGGYLVAPASPPAPLLVGFHGYGESASTILGHLQRIPGADAFTLASVEPLHRFYNTKTGDVVGSWMTKLDREQAIADNVAYVASVLDALVGAHQPSRVVLAGF